MINSALNILVFIVVIAGIVIIIAFIIWMFWNMMFTPVYKLRKYNIKKQEDEKEYNRIIVAKANEIEAIEHKKDDYAKWHMKVEQEKLDYEKWQKKNGEIAAKFEEFLKIQPKTKGK